MVVAGEAAASSDTTRSTACHTAIDTTTRVATLRARAARAAAIPTAVDATAAVGAAPRLAAFRAGAARGAAIPTASDAAVDAARCPARPAADDAAAFTASRAGLPEPYHRGGRLVRRHPPWPG